MEQIPDYPRCSGKIKSPLEVDLGGLEGDLVGCNCSSCKRYFNPEEAFEKNPKSLITWANLSPEKEEKCKFFYE